MNKRIFVFMSQEGSKQEENGHQLLSEYFKAVEDFFDENCHFKSAKKNLKTLLNAAFSKEFLIKEDISEIRTLHVSLAKLIGFTSQPQINDTICKLPAVEGILDEDGHLERKLYCGELVGNVYTEWHYYPRYLSKKEFKDPSLVFQRFFEYKSLKEWETVLDDLLSAALSHGTVLDNSDAIDHPLLVESHLCKFLEASHIMKVSYIDQKAQD